jgi:hypothetical protein
LVSRHYDAGGYQDDENEEDMENDDEFGSDAERGKQNPSLQLVNRRLMKTCLSVDRGPWAYANTAGPRRQHGWFPSSRRVAVIVDA